MKRRRSGAPSTSAGGERKSEPIPPRRWTGNGDRVSHMNTAFALSLFSGELQARGWFYRELAFLLGLAAVVAVGVLYAKEIGRLGAGRRLVLAGLRMMTVLVVAFLLLRPVWVVDQGGDKRRPIAVLIDVSQSMDSK